MGKKMGYGFLEGAKKMPPLRHTLQGQRFDIAMSEVAGWLTAQPEIMQKVFDIARYHGAIVYDPGHREMEGGGL